MINLANRLVHKVCDGRQTPKSIIGNVETISLSCGEQGPSPEIERGGWQRGTLPWWSRREAAQGQEQHWGRHTYVRGGGADA
jgi:hypothetical protein